MTLLQRFNRSSFWDWHPRTFTDWARAAATAAPVVFFVALLVLLVVSIL